MSPEQPVPINFFNGPGKLVLTGPKVIESTNKFSGVINQTQEVSPEGDLQDISSAEITIGYDVELKNPNTYSNIVKSSTTLNINVANNNKIDSNIENPVGGTVNIINNSETNRLFGATKHIENMGAVNFNSNGTFTGSLVDVLGDSPINVKGNYIYTSSIENFSYSNLTIEAGGHLKFEADYESTNVINLGTINIDNSSYTILANNTLQNGNTTSAGILKVNNNGSIWIGSNAADTGSVLESQNGNININSNGTIVLVGQNALFDNKELSIVTNNSDGPTGGAGIGINPGSVNGKIKNAGIFKNYGIMEIGSGKVENTSIAAEFNNGDYNGELRGGMKFIEGSTLLNEATFYNNNKGIIEIFGATDEYNPGIITNNGLFTNNGIIYQGSGNVPCLAGTITQTQPIDGVGTISQTCI